MTDWKTIYKPMLSDLIPDTKTITKEEAQTVFDHFKNNPLFRWSWAEKVTDVSVSYYVIKDSNYYIFKAGKLLRDNWNRQNKQNFKWTIQGLAGINGVSKRGQAALVFNKRRIENTAKRFQKEKHRKPVGLK